MSKCTRCGSTVIKYVELGMRGRVCAGCGKDSAPAKGFAAFIPLLPRRLFVSRITGQVHPQTSMPN